MTDRVISFGIALLLAAFGLMVLWPIDRYDEPERIARAPRDDAH